MSCTISALPFGLLFAVVSSITTGIEQERKERERLEQTAMSTQMLIDNTNRIKEQINSRLRENLAANQGEISQEQINSICKKYQTVFMDRDLLMKTLQEYGIQTLVVNKNRVSADIENFHLEFYRENETVPFDLKVTCTEECDETVILSDLNSEYGMNAQEETYIKIKERLAQKNMKIDEEEILEDDSIMLTINLD